MVATGGAVEQEPAAPGAPGVCREPLRPLKGRGLRPDVDPFDSRRDVVEDRRLAQGGYQAGIGPDALVARDVEPAGVAGHIANDGVQVRSFALIGHRPESMYELCRRPMLQQHRDKAG
jgi:hypothetical protein